MGSGDLLIAAGFLVIILGVFLIVAGFVYKSLRGGADVEVGGVLVIGPIPIIFGDAKIAIISAILAILMIILIYVMFYKNMFS